MKTLNLTFKGSLGKTHVLKLHYASDQLDAKTVQAAMDQIANATSLPRMAKNSMPHQSAPSTSRPLTTGWLKHHRQPPKY